MRLGEDSELLMRKEVVTNLSSNDSSIHKAQKVIKLSDRHES